MLPTIPYNLPFSLHYLFFSLAFPPLYIGLLAGGQDLVPALSAHTVTGVAGAMKVLCAAEGQLGRDTCGRLATLIRTAKDLERRRHQLKYFSYLKLLKED